MSSISTEGPAHPTIALPFMQKARERAFTLGYVLATAVATLGWLYTLSEGLLIVIDWLFF